MKELSSNSHNLDDRSGTALAPHQLHSCSHDHSAHGHVAGGHGACSEPVPQSHEAQSHDKAALISARGLNFTRGGRHILQDVALDLPAGEIVTLIGPNGAGKTTLVRIMLGLERPDGGNIWRRPDLVIGYAPQRFDVDRAMPLSVSRFLTLGKAASPDEIAVVLAEVGAAGLADRQLARLSGGELQRVVLARALLRDPGLLVLDEPVRGVDFAGEAELYKLIGTLRDRRGVGVLLVSHDLHIVMAQADRVICLNGHVCCSGQPQRVAQHPEYARLFGPAAASAIGIYQHSHDHSHDLAGAAIPAVENEPAKEMPISNKQKEKEGEERDTPPDEERKSRAQREAP